MRIGRIVNSRNYAPSKLIYRVVLVGYMGTTSGNRLYGITREIVLSAVHRSVFGDNSYLPVNRIVSPTIRYRPYVIGVRYRGTLKLSEITFSIMSLKNSYLLCGPTSARRRPR